MKPLALDGLVEAALAEDMGAGDRTSEWAVPAGITGRARIEARAAGVLAGVGAADRTFRRLDPSLSLAWRRRAGERIEPGETAAELRGPIRSILTAERTALNFLAHLSGIATHTARFVSAVEGTGCRVTDTRKTTPGWRALEKAATAAGGAANHRMGLHDMVLLKENHLRAAGGIRAALEAAASRAREMSLPVAVEVTALEGLDQVLERPADRRPDRILLDNMPPPSLRKAVLRVRRTRGSRPLLEATGGVTLDSVREVAETGVDLVSVGAITHSAPALDLTLLLEDR